MKIKNENTESLINFLIKLLLSVLVFGVFAKLFKINIFGIPYYYFILISAVIIALIYYRGPQELEFDGMGEVIIIKYKHLFISKILPEYNKVIEFPKRKLLSAKLKGKRLEVVINSKNSSSKKRKLKFNMNYMPKSDLNEILKSLEKDMKEYKEHGVDSIFDRNSSFRD